MSTAFLPARSMRAVVKALGMEGISKSRLSELCEQLDEEVERFRGRPLEEGSYPYLWIDATYLKARQDGRVASVAVVIAVGVKAKTGEREVLGLDVGPSEDGAFCGRLFSALVSRPWPFRRETGNQSDSLIGVSRVPSRLFLQGASWQRCRVHFMRNALSLVPKAAQQMLGATIRTPSSPSPMPGVLASSGGGSQTASVLDSRSSPSCWTRPKRTCSPTRASLRSTGRRSGLTTPWRGSTRRSRGGQRW
jgi:hypothetical protein